jgi:hypothetical protein
MLRVRSAPDQCSPTVHRAAARQRVTVRPFPAQPSLRSERVGCESRAGTVREVCPGWSSFDAAGATAFSDNSQANPTKLRCEGARLRASRDRRLGGDRPVPPRRGCPGSARGRLRKAQGRRGAYGLRRATGRHPSRGGSSGTVPWTDCSVSQIAAHSYRPLERSSIERWSLLNEVMPSVAP